MVQLGATCGDQLIAHLDWERNIHQFIAMDMADLAPLAQTVLSPAVYSCQSASQDGI